MSPATSAALRESGQSWLGEVPSHWDLRKLGHHFTERKETVNDSDYAPLSVTMQGIVPQLETAAKSDANDKRKLVLKGDFVINSRSDRKGSSGISPLDGSVSQISIVLEPKNISQSFVNYLLRSYPFQEEFYKWGSGIVADLWSTRFSAMKQILIPVPPRDEQDVIVDFLERELEAIDALASRQVTLIGLLAQRKVSSIAGAVTGATLDCHFSELSMPWLKRFPSAWKRGRVKQVGQVKLGKMIQQESKYPEDVQVPYLSSTSVQETGITVDQEKKMWASPKELFDLQIKKNDVLVLEGGAAGRSFRANEDIEGVVFQNSLNRVRLNEDQMTPKFFDYWMSYLVSKGVVEAVCNKATIMHLTAEKLNDLPVLIPPLEEQVEITNHLDSLVDYSDRLTHRAQTVLNVLSERRAALISAAVTGKINLKVNNLG